LGYLTFVMYIGRDRSTIGGCACGYSKAVHLAIYCITEVNVQHI